LYSNLARSYRWAQARPLGHVSRLALTRAKPQIPQGAHPERNPPPSGQDENDGDDIGQPDATGERGYTRRVGAEIGTTVRGATVACIVCSGWFALHTVFASVHETSPAGLRLLVPEWRSVQVPALLLSAGALVATFRYRVGMFPLLGGCAALGVVYELTARG